MSEDVRRMVGRNVKRLRISAGLSQAELAERMGVDRAYVSGLELGQRNPAIVTLWHVAEALSVKLRLFFDERGTLVLSIAANDMDCAQEACGSHARHRRHHPRARKDQHQLALRVWHQTWPARGQAPANMGWQTR